MQSEKTIRNKIRDEIKKEMIARAEMPFAERLVKEVKNENKEKWKCKICGKFGNQIIIDNNIHLCYKCYTQIDKYFFRKIQKMLRRSGKMIKK